MKKEETGRVKPLHFVLALIVSFLLFNLGFIVDQTFRWSNPVEGFINGVLHMAFMGLAWCFFLLPWSLIIFALYRWRKWQRHRTAWLLAPAIAAFVLPIIGLVIERPTPRRTFAQMIVSPVPESVRNLKVFRSGGGVADYTYIIYFEIDPADFKTVIASRPFELSGRELNNVPIFRTSWGTNTVRSEFRNSVGSAGWPSPYEWGEVEVYTYHTKDRGWFYHIITDKEHRKVYFDAGSI